MSSPSPTPSRHTPSPHPQAFHPSHQAVAAAALEGPAGSGTAFEPEPAAHGPAWAPDAAAHAPPSALLHSPEARAALQVLQAFSLPAPSLGAVQAAASAAQNLPAHRQLLSQSRDALMGAGPAPEPEAWGQAMAAVLGGGPANKPFARNNVTAYVFLVMLEAQKDAIEEKRESLRALKMHAGMLEDLNAWVARVVVPAQRALNAKIKAGHFKDSITKRDKAAAAARQERVEETLGVPDTIDTQWGAVEADTGKVFIPLLAQSAVTPKKLDAQELASLITQTDQWRATMQNNQNKQSMDFKRIDDAMSSLWNMLSAFLKSAQEGANAIIRNGVG